MQLEITFYSFAHTSFLKLNFRLYIRPYTSPKENFEYSYPLNEQTYQILMSFSKEIQFNIQLFGDNHRR